MKYISKWGKSEEPTLWRQRNPLSNWRRLQCQWGIERCKTSRPTFQHPWPPHLSQRRELNHAGPQQNRRRGPDHPKLHPRPRFLHLRISQWFQTHRLLLLLPVCVIRYSRLLESAHRRTDIPDSLLPFKQALTVPPIPSETLDWDSNSTNPTQKDRIFSYRNLRLGPPNPKPLSPKKMQVSRKCNTKTSISKP